MSDNVPLDIRHRILSFVPAEEAEYAAENLDVDPLYIMEEMHELGIDPVRLIAEKRHRNSEMQHFQEDHPDIVIIYHIMDGYDWDIVNGPYMPLFEMHGITDEQLGEIAREITRQTGIPSEYDSDRMEISLDVGVDRNEQFYHDFVHYDILLHQCKQQTAGNFHHTLSRE